MYLSQLTLDPRSRSVQRDIAHPRELHRTVMRGFADDLDKTAERVLFRLDQHPQTAALTLLVQSAHVAEVVGASGELPAGCRWQSRRQAI